MLQAFRDLSLFRSSADASVSMSAAACHSLIGIAELNMSLLRSLHDLGTTATKSLHAADKPANALSGLAGAVHPAIESMVTYGNDLQSLLGKVQAEFGQILDAQVEGMTRGVQAHLDQVASKAPAGGDVVVAAARSVVDAASKQYAGASKAAKEAGDKMQSGMSSITNVVVQNILNSSRTVAKKAA